jgi:hypothetical protein
MNRYLYAHANPWTLVDPTGHAATCSVEFDSCGQAVKHYGGKGPTKWAKSNTKRFTSKDYWTSYKIRRDTRIARDVRDERKRDPERRTPVDDAYKALAHFKRNYDEERGWSTLPQDYGHFDKADVQRIAAVGAGSAYAEMTEDFATSTKLNDQIGKYIPGSYQAIAFFEGGGRAGAEQLITLMLAKFGTGGEGMGPGGGMSVSGIGGRGSGGGGSGGGRGTGGHGGSGPAPGDPPPNLSPPGAGRHGAFAEAKRDLGVPVSMQPTRVLPNVDRRGQSQPGRIYEFDIPGRGTVRIRDDAAGHDWGAGNPQTRGPHFNTEGKRGDENLHYDYG